MKLTRQFSVLLLLFFTGNVIAEVNFNGFVTVAAGTTFDDDETTLGYDGDFDFKSESLFGLQASSDIGEGFSVTAQLVGRGEDDFNTEFSWAYISYEISDSDRINIGRQRIPFYTYSDFLDVGYAYHWIRPPQALYAIAFSNADGISWVHNGFVGDWDSSFQLLYGRFNGIAEPGGVPSPSDLRNFTSVAYSLSQEEWSFRFAYTFCAECFIDVEPLQPILDGLVGAGFADIAADAAFDGDFGYFMDFGAKYDAGDWFVEAEVGKLEVEDTFLATTDSWYVTAGIRSDDLTYHLTVESADDTPNNGLIARLPPATVDPFFGIVAGFLAGQESDTDAVTVGIRYDVAPSAALKFDIHSLDNNGLAPDVTLFTVALTTVF